MKQYKGGEIGHDYTLICLVLNPFNKFINWIEVKNYLFFLPNVLLYFIKKHITLYCYEMFLFPQLRNFEAYNNRMAILLDLRSQLQKCVCKKGKVAQSVT